MLTQIIHESRYPFPGPAAYPACLLFYRITKRPTKKRADQTISALDLIKNQFNRLTLVVVVLGYVYPLASPS
jgi:hypothetical protein